MLQNIPHELRLLRHWVTWKLEETEGRDPTKVPYSPATERHASVSNSNTWNTFNDVVQAVSVPGKWNGAGFVFVKGTGFVGIDLDNPIKKLEAGLITKERYDEIMKRQYEIAMMLQPYGYMETSPSGNGLHIIVRGYVPAGRRRNFIEIYDDKRFFTMTGKVWGNGGAEKPIRECQHIIDMLFAELGSPAATYTHFDDAPQSEDDMTIIEKAMTAENGAKFKVLWEGAWQEYYSSQSEADQAICNIIQFYTKNKEQVIRIWGLSALGRRDKYFRTEYQQWTVNRAFDMEPPPLDIEGLRDSMYNQLLARQQEQAALPPPEPKPHVETIIPPKLAAPRDDGWIIPVDTQVRPKLFPPGLVGDIAMYIYQSSPRPIAEISLGAALGFMAGICGRSFNIDGSGLNLYLMCIAPSGVGKAAMSSGIEKIMKEVNATTLGETKPFDIFVGPSAIASGPALVKYMDKVSPSFVSLTGEVGLYLASLDNVMHNPNAASMRSAFLDFYGKSGHSEVVRPTVYSDMTKNTVSIKSPALTWLGESTGERFYEALNEQSVADGLTNRFIIIEYHGDVVPTNKNRPSWMPAGTKAQLMDLLEKSTMANQAHLVTNVECDEQAGILFDQFDEHCDNMQRGKTELLRGPWSRAMLKAKRVAALIAVGINHAANPPKISYDVAHWAITLILNDITNILGKFERGEIGRNTEEIKQIKHYVHIVKEYMLSPYATVQKYGVNREMFSDRIIPIAYIQRRLSAQQSFKNDRMGATNAIKRATQLLVDEGALREVSKADLAPYKFSGKAYMVSDFQRFDL